MRLSRSQTNEHLKRQGEIAAWQRIKEAKGRAWMKGEPPTGDLTPYTGKVIVDLGCGPRRFLEYFPARLGVKIDCCMLGYLHQGLMERAWLADCPCVQGMGENLPLADVSVDYVFAINMLDHTFDPGRVTSECLRVLRPGGEVHLNVDIGGEPNECEPVVFSEDDVSRLFSQFRLIHEERRPASNTTRDHMLIRIYRKPPS